MWNSYLVTFNDKKYYEYYEIFIGLKNYSIELRQKSIGVSFSL